ncbi:MAG: hypothetical protein VX498_10040 [Myxococcota bacterium]|nr:hypothetical protein [Myxococcota bacterium]
MSKLSGRRLGLLCLVFCLLVVLFRVSFTGLGEYRRALALEEEERWHEAAVHHGRSIHMYLPLSPLPTKSGERLLALAAAATERNEPWEARFCYEELRSSFLAIRSFYQPGQRFITSAEDGLVPLMLADERGNWPDRSLQPSERESLLREVFAEREDPSLGWVLLMGLGYLLWLGGAGLGIWRALPVAAEEPIRWPLLGRFAAVSLLGYGLWLLAVWQA